MRGFCKVIIVGNMTRDCELRYLPSGAAVGQFGMAINRTWKDNDGNAKEEVTFIDVTVFGKSAETITQYCKKGSAVLIEGRLKTESWEDKQTQQKRSKLSVVAESFQFLDGKPKDQEQFQPAQLPPRKRPEVNKPAQDSYQEEDPNWDVPH